MNYQKPMVMELGLRARKAQGNLALNCVSGDAASGAYETCAVGDGAAWEIAPCVSGASTSGHRKSDCLSGSAVAYYCENGAAGNNDPYGCRTGISFA